MCFCISLPLPDCHCLGKGSATKIWRPNPASQALFSCTWAASLAALRRAKVPWRWRRRDFATLGNGRRLLHEQSSIRVIDIPKLCIHSVVDLPTHLWFVSSNFAYPIIIRLNYLWVLLVGMENSLVNQQIKSGQFAYDDIGRNLLRNEWL